MKETVLQVCETSCRLVMVPEGVDLSAALLVCGLVGLKATLLGLLPAMTDALKAVKMVEKLVDCEAGMTAGQKAAMMVCSQVV